MTLQVESPTVYTSQGVPISVTGIAQVKIQGQNEEMLNAACEQFLGKRESEIQNIALVTLEGHQRAIMGSMTVEVNISFGFIYNFLKKRISLIYKITLFRKFIKIEKNSVSMYLKWLHLILLIWE